MHIPQDVRQIRSVLDSYCVMSRRVRLSSPYLCIYQLSTCVICNISIKTMIKQHDLSNAQSIEA